MRPASRGPQLAQALAALLAGVPACAAPVVAEAWRGEPTIDPRSVEGQPWRDASPRVGDAYLNELYALAAQETCAVPPRIATRPAEFAPEIEGRVRELDAAARAACELGLHRLPYRVGADGARAVQTGPNGSFAIGSALFIGPDAEPVTLRGAVQVAAADACTEATSAAPSVELVGLSVAGLTVELTGGDSSAFLVSTEGCPLGEERSLVLAKPGVQRVWVAGVPGERFELRVSPTEGVRWVSGLRWSPGQRLDLPVSVTLPTTGAEFSGFPNCSGYLPADPSFAFEVTTDGWGRIGATSEYDAVIAVRGPYGEVLCNDDSDGTNPAVEAYLSVGLYTVWVGTYSAQTTLSGWGYVQ